MLSTTSTTGHEPTLKAPVGQVDLASSNQHGLLRDATPTSPDFVTTVGDELELDPSARLIEDAARLVRPVVPAPPEPVVFDADLIPDVGESTRVRSEDDVNIDTILARVDIIDAYRRWCGKMEPKIGGKRESIMISCPKPDHPDKHPSASANLDKGLYNCFACSDGGDIYTIAGFKFEIDPNGPRFPELRRRMAEDLGYTVKRTLGGTEYVASAPPAADATGPLKRTLVTHDDFKDDDASGGSDIVIAWRTLLPAGTFLRGWMEAITVDDLPEEFHFWLALQTVGLAAGNDVVLQERHPVRGNLFLTLLGATGLGKSKATQIQAELLRESLPYDHDDPTSTGTLLVPTPGSAEALVDTFSKPELDSASPAKIVGYNPVRGLVRFDEFASFSQRAARSGSTLKQTLMEFYDGYHPIELRSRGAGYVRAEKHFCSAVTTTQPRSIREVVTRGDADSGFLNRWVFVAGKQKPLDAFGGPRVSLDHLVEQLRELRAWASKRRDLTMSPAAQDLWEKFFREHIEAHRVSDDQPLLTRIDLTLKKVIVLLAVNERSSIVTEDIVERAIALHKYLLATYRLVDRKLGAGSPFDECENAILRLLMKDPNLELTLREIFGRRLHQRYARSMVSKSIGVLLVHGEIEEIVRKPKAGPTTPRYRYVVPV